MINETNEMPIFNVHQANQLVKLPLICIQQEYPNKTGQVYYSKTDLKTPRQLHPAFYGCFDWHSAVHGHWCLIALLKQFNNLEQAELIKKYLSQNISTINIKQEVTYFKTHQNFERTYGWAWLLKLSTELVNWQDPLSIQLQKNLQPLTQLIIDSFINFLPKLTYPLRVGTHTNTAFALLLALEFALASDEKNLIKTIKEAAIKFYIEDKNYPTHLEPDGFDFLSPSLQEAALMQKILNQTDFEVWLGAFMPDLKAPSFSLKPVEVSNRNDGHLVHLEGLNFSRAWCLFNIANSNPQFEHLKNTASQHLNHALPNIFNHSYAGAHWLGSFALLALQAKPKTMV